MIKRTLPISKLARVFAVWSLSLTMASLNGFADTATGTRGMIATVHPLATDAGRNAFERGGNAIDAAIAAALTLGVVDGHNSGIGGGCFILVRRPDGSMLAIDGRETAPAAATRDMFIRNGVADTSISQDGALAVAIPGALAAYSHVLKSAGKLALESHLLPAAEIAETGFAVDNSYARRLRSTKPLLEMFPETKRTLLKPDGSSYVEGEILRLPDLANSYRQIAEHEDWFYQGEYAEKVASWMQANGGVITVDDMHQYKSIEREPIRSTYRGHEIVGFPPPTSGGIHVAQILNILENFDLADLLKRRPIEAYHIVAEAMKLAFADRAKWLGDADFVPVPRGLVSKEYAAELARLIKTDAAIEVKSHGMPKDWQTDVYSKHTTHISAADAEGNWVAITTTINTSFGSKIIIPGTGIVLNNTLDDFSAQPGVPNAFGLVGGDANAVTPLKRALSSMSPTIVLKDGEPIFTVGVAGGPKIITQVVMAIVHRIDGKFSLAESLERPRLHHQWLPNKIVIESRFDPSVRRGLTELGHELEEIEQAAVAQGIERTSEGQFIGTSDPRVPGKASEL